MKKQDIRQIQKKIIALLRKYSDKPLYVASTDNCSEVARLVGCWIFKKLPRSKIYIFKGKNVKGTKKCHDILAIENNQNIDIIDPTVWQFFKNKKSIFIKTTNNLTSGLLEASKIYGGQWKISETLKANNCKNNDFEKVIALNIKELNKI